ncbi:MAG: ribonuclease P protein component [Chlorobiaceae bacterium]|nr:ribonuclease P protein component [Chlorobiaceae bacterium]MBA4310187.1 ribonuclease P protein component [Chlorobiaceae bacterium]
MKKFSLSKNERIKKRKSFEQIYLGGRFLISSDKKLKLIYLENNFDEKEIVQIAVAVSKKAGKAVWRNRMKRLVREAYRLNKLELLEFCKQENKSVLIVFSPYVLNEKQNKKIELFEITPGIVDLMNKLKSILR